MPELYNIPGKNTTKITVGKENLSENNRKQHFFKKIYENLLFCVDIGGEMIYNRGVIGCEGAFASVNVAFCGFLENAAEKFPLCRKTAKPRIAGNSDAPSEGNEVTRQWTLKISPKATANSE